MSAAELLLAAHRSGVVISHDGRGNLTLAPASLITTQRLQAVRRLKPQLLPLVVALEQHSAINDPLILETVALFQVSPEGIKTMTETANARSVRPASALLSQNHLGGRIQQQTQPELILCAETTEIT
jgi:hypothetical protein